MSEAPCIRCRHAEADHQGPLAWCDVPGCSCLCFVDEADELEAGLARGEYPGELRFDHDEEDR